MEMEMYQEKFCHKVEQLLSLADVKINGDRPWDIQVHNDKLYTRFLAEGSLGVGESYMDGWWDCDRLDQLFDKVFMAELDAKIKPLSYLFEAVKAKIVNMQRPSRAFRIGRHHYDMGNDLYRCMLDKRMIYSCAYWKDEKTLDQAQEAKLDLICRKLGLKSGMRVLDIGCGWGGTAKFAAQRYKVEVVGITVSDNQYQVGKELCRGLPVEIRMQDYRSLDGVFDRILSIGMIEHVGCKNYPTFMRVVKKRLKKDGLFLLHTIGGNSSVTSADPWINRYIFPDSILPSAKQLCTAFEGLFVLEDWHGFGVYYDKTLMYWFKNFHDNWDVLKKSYDERFYRMWKFYLLACAGAFRARMNQVWQIVLSPEGVPNGYQAQR